MHIVGKDQPEMLGEYLEATCYMQGLEVQSLGVACMGVLVYVMLDL